MPLAVLAGAIVPHTAGVHAVPPWLSVQVTLLLLVPVTVAVNG